MALPAGYEIETDSLPAGYELEGTKKAKPVSYDASETIDGVPKWGRDNPNLYAGVETALDMLPMLASPLKTTGVGIPVAGALNAVGKYAQRKIADEPTTAADVGIDFLKGATVEGGGRALGGLVKGATNLPAVRQGLGNLSDKFSGMTLKQSTKLKPELRAQNLDTLHEFGILPNAKGVDKLNTIISANENKLSGGVAAGDKAGVKGDLEKAILNLENLRGDANLSSDPALNNKLIDDEIQRLVDHPLVDTQGNLPISDLQQMKVNQGKEISKAYDNARMSGVSRPSFATDIDKARVRGFKETLEDRLRGPFPELADTNNLLSRLYQASKANTSAVNRLGNNQGVGIALPTKSGAGALIGGMVGGPPGAAVGGTIGTLVGVAEHPAVAPRIGQTLYNLSRKFPAKGGNKAVRNIGEVTAPALRAAFEGAMYGTDPLSIRGGE